ncbi:MAG: tRNA (guanosine(46)-N7)-methyltransferase TrmB [Alphaproteobacteria bacterium]
MTVKASAAVSATLASEQRPASWPHRRVPGRGRVRTLKPAHAAALARDLPRLAICLDPVDGGAAMLEPRRLFARPGPVWLEIGFGAGEHLAWQAQHHPDIGFIGVEPYRAGLARLLVRLTAADITNVRLYDDDAALLLARLAPASLERIFILFPDPWPKTRHHKRRLVQTHTVDLLARALCDGGELRLASDDPDYGAWCLARLTACPDLAWQAQRPADWQSWCEAAGQETVATRYEEKARQAGRKPLYLRFRRRPRAVGGPTAPDSA